MKKFVLFILITAFIQASQTLISPYGLFTLSDFVFYRIKNYDFNPKDTFEGAIICAKTKDLDVFFTEYHPKIKHRYVLITQDDQLSPGKYSNYLDDPKIIAWFGRNPSMPNTDKFYALPIGMNCYSKKQMKNIDVCHRLSKIQTKKEHLFYLNIDEKKSRGNIKRIFQDQPYCTNSSRKPFQEYLMDLKKSRFVLSPPGHGIDCYRTWEAILMGSIPIVLSSFMDPLFEKLPVLIVKDWSEINEIFLNSKYKEISEKQTNMDKLYLDYWNNQFRRAISRAGIQRSYRPML